MNTDDLQLHNYAITRLHIDHIVKAGETLEVVGYETGWNYEVQIHNEDKCRYRLIFSMTFNEVTVENERAGFQIDTSIVGLFSFNEKMTTQDREKYIRINGVSILYGTLRGYLANVTGSFPHGKFVLPAIMPQEIVKTVEKQKAAGRKAAKEAKA